MLRQRIVPGITYYEKLTNNRLRFNKLNFQQVHAGTRHFSRILYPLITHLCVLYVHIILIYSPAPYIPYAHVTILTRARVIFITLTLARTMFIFFHPRVKFHSRYYSRLLLASTHARARCYKLSKRIFFLFFFTKRLYFSRLPAEKGRQSFRAYYLSFHPAPSRSL